MGKFFVAKLYADTCSQFIKKENMSSWLTIMIFFGGEILKYVSSSAKSCSILQFGSKCCQFYSIKGLFLYAVVCFLYD